MFSVILASNQLKVAAANKLNRLKDWNLVLVLGAEVFMIKTLAAVMLNA
jgi:hypothetical protein